VTCVLCVAVKGVNFYGPRSEYVVTGSDCGNVFVWHKRSMNIVNYFHADDGGVVRLHLSTANFTKSELKL